MLHGSIRSSIEVEASRRHEDHFLPPTDPAHRRMAVLHCAGRHATGRQGSIALRDPDGINLIIAARNSPRSPESPKPPGFVLLDPETTETNGERHERDESMGGVELVPTREKE